MRDLYHVAGWHVIIVVALSALRAAPLIGQVAAMHGHGHSCALTL